MTDKQKHLFRTLKGKTFFFVLVFVLILDTGTAVGAASATDNYLSSKTLRSMARIYMAHGEYAKAQPLAEQALTAARIQNVPDSELAMCLIDLATLYNYQGNLAEAENMCQLGMQLQEKILYKNHPYLAYTLRTLSSIYYEQGEYCKAKSTLDQAVAIMLDSHSAEDKAMAPFFVDIANILTAQSSLEQAESYYQKAMSLINNSYGPNHLYTANILAGIAKLYTLQGRFYEAEELIDRAILIQERVYGPDHHLLSASWLIKAKICREKGDRAQAEIFIKKALTAAEETGNKSALAKFQKEAKDIRTNKQVAYFPMAQSNE